MSKSNATLLTGNKKTLVLTTPVYGIETTLICDYELFKRFGMIDHNLIDVYTHDGDDVDLCDESWMEVTSKIIDLENKQVKMEKK
jgi:hypothetical protein